MGSSFTPAALICSAKPSSESFVLLARVASRAFCSRNSETWRAFSRSATTSNWSPACGSPSSPSTSTGVDGGASSTTCPRSSNMARTLPKVLPRMKLSPMCSVPFCTRTVATEPRPRSILASTTVPLAGRSGLALSSPRSATRQIISISRLRLVRSLAETSTQGRRSDERHPGRSTRTSTCRYLLLGVERVT